MGAKLTKAQKEAAAEDALKNDPLIRNKIKKAFEKFDDDNSGFIEIAEVVKIMCFKNADGEQQFTENEAKEHLAEFDENGDGKWSCEEFVTFCMETGDHGHSHLAMVKEALVAHGAWPED